MSQSPLQSLRRYLSISVFGGGIVVTVLVLIACGLGMVAIVSGYVEGERRNYLNGLEQTLNEIQVSETSFRNGVANAQLIWREADNASESVVDAFFRDDQRVVMRPYPSLVLGVPGQTGERAEVARYLSLSVLLSRICAASSINRGRTLEGYHYSTRTGMFGLVPNRNRDDPALVSPESRARVLEALRVDFGRTYPGVDARPHVRWLAPFTDPVSGQPRIRIAAEAHDNGKTFAVLVTEYPPDYLLSWLADYRPEGAFYITTADGRLVTMDPAAGDADRVARLLKLAPWRGGASPGAPEFRDGFVLFRGKLETTGWTLAYALSWADIAAGVARSAGTLVAATLLTLAVMWGLLLRFHRREFAPLYARSQRVFDSEALCRSVIEMAPIGLGLIARDDGRFLLASPALTEMVARIGGDYHVLSSQVAAAWQAHVGSGDTSGVLHDDIVLGGDEAAHLHLEFIACGARYQGADVLIAAVADSTAKRQLVQKLEEAVRAADSANAAKSSFLAATSHEIRTPLNVILGNLELLERSALDAVQHGRVSTLRTSATSLLALVSDILDFSKIEAGAMSVESIEFDVIATVEHELNAFSTIAKSKGLQLFCEIRASSTQRMRGDPTRLAQVLRNLLNNALKFTDAGRVTVRIAVVAEGHDAPELSIEIEDTGIGIAAEHRSKLFKAFSQVDASISRRYGGTGLGLALCDRLVTAMGGSIEVASEPGVGSCFTVRLPLGADVAALGRPYGTRARALTLIAAHPEWRDFALPHLHAWGFDVSVHDSLSSLPGGLTGPVVLFGDPDSWSRAELDSLRDCAPLILAARDGPLEPYRAGSTVGVSSYSLSGMRAALTRGGPTGGKNGSDAVSGGEPRRGDSPARDSVAGKPSSGAAAQGSHALRVLVADDESVNGSIFSEQLHALGCTVAGVGSGRAALEALAVDDWDVLLIGADLPDMVAHQLAEAARGTAAACDVLVVTSHLTPEGMHRCMTAGVRRVLTKPVTLGHLRGALAHAWQRRAATPAKAPCAAACPPDPTDHEKALHDN
ncbi:ATP-binding protein [Burkholderia ubonensis]|uniref:Virulence sensor protein BvgS n=1 Tax=Burkholderia ubonensis TaxID=101571 RepID=A0AB74CXA5_9BURK|nr:ATP-binding protein [Burkholderia ubonensis]PAJ78174.1 hybrid sensor histidine kinase/response regulator [Burkholderia ubonensis]PAJ84508.1 hybrid sensor histidine kinase/response regulator [Burkholderia ubonensis]PAJ91321.1 hybrid sensor histidine kinase/response regulator [Burkholderia ubonensis]PAJ98716.1 hybrid sensor histidine kinase/response regulator [Burkholderia ubonensis]PAK04593.1 hybrid sensor histidine kinase/response regulator [Burkholderia ubonensis]